METIQEIRNAIMGKRISHYDSFSGSSDWFTIGYVKNEKKSIRVFPERGKGWGVWIEKKHLPELLQSGSYVKNFEIEHCSCHEQWELFNA